MKKVLLDENLPRQLKNYFSADFSVTSVPDLRRQSKKNGELLDAMREQAIDILLTSDRNLRFQQNLSASGVKVAVIVAVDNRLKRLAASIEVIEEKLKSLAFPDEYLEIDLRNE